MRQELKRIETMLARLADQHQQETVASTSVGTGVAQTAINAQTTIDPVVHPPSVDTFKALPPLLPQRPAVSLPASAIATNAALNVLVQPVLADLQAAKSPTLPKLKSPAVTHQPVTDPASAATRALKAIEAVTTSWQEELQQVLQQVQTVYQEGPIVDGWLEAYTSAPENPPLVQPTNANHVSIAGKKAPIAPSATGLTATTEGYRLCGLNESGQLWFRHCPTEQVPAVSLAIARHQSLKQLLIRKQNLELRLSTLAEALVKVYGHLENRQGNC